MRITIFFLLFFAYQSVRGQEFRSENYSFQNKLTPMQLAKDARWGVVELDEEVYRNSHYNDLRLSLEGFPIPYLRVIKKDSLGTSGRVIPKIVFTKKYKDSIHYVLEIPRIPSHTAMEHLIVSSPNSFESEVRFYLGDEVDQWTQEGENFLFQYETTGSSNNLKLPLHSEYSRYIRIETKNSLELQFPSLVYGKTDRMREIEFVEDLNSPKIDSDKRSSVYYFSNEKGNPFKSIRLQFQETNYNRRFEVWAMDESLEYYSIQTGYLTAHATDSQLKKEIRLHTTIAGAWKLVIDNEDNPALNLVFLATYHPVESLYFSTANLPQDKLSDIHLFYGYRYARPPEYDTTGFPDGLNQENSKSFGKIMSFQLGQHSINPVQSLSVWYPPMSIWITRVLYWLGLTIVAFLAFRSIQDWRRLTH